MACDDPATWQMLAEKGHIVAANGKSAAIALPRHLLGVEVATSVFEAAVLGRSSGTERPVPRFDLTVVAETDLSAGTLLRAEGHHHSIRNVSARLTPVQPFGPSATVPYYLAAGATLARPVRAGTTLSGADLRLPPDSAMLKLRTAGA